MQYSLNQWTDFNIKTLEAGLDFEHLPYWDVVIIGAGPAGLAASLTTAHRALTTLVIEAKDRAGGQPQFLYADKSDRRYSRDFRTALPANELSERTSSQAVEPRSFNFASTKNWSPSKTRMRPRSRRSSRRADSTFKAFYEAVGDYEGKNVAVVGGGDSALDAALMVLGRQGHVDLIVRETVPVGKADTLSRIRDAGAVVHVSSEIEAAEFAGEQIRLTVTGRHQIDCSIAIVQIGFLSAKDTFERLDVRLNEDSSIAIDPYFETSRQGIFAVGDVHGDIKLIAVAWAEGIQAAIHAFKEITSPYWLNEKRLRDSKIALIGEKITQAARARKKNP